MCDLQALSQKVIGTHRRTRAVPNGFMGARALITKVLWWKLRIKRNRLHHGGLWERTAIRIGTALTQLSVYIFWQRGCNGPLPGNAWRRQLNGHLSLALVQGPPLQAIWYCTTHRLATVNRVTDN